MKIRELEAMLGSYAPLCLHPAYPKPYLRIARMNNAAVSKERMDDIRQTINQHIKELKKHERSLRNYKP